MRNYSVKENAWFRKVCSSVVGYYSYHSLYFVLGNSLLQLGYRKVQ